MLNKRFMYGILYGVITALPIAGICIKDSPFSLDNTLLFNLGFVLLIIPIGTLLLLMPILNFLSIFTWTNFGPVTAFFLSPLLWGWIFYKFEWFSRPYWKELARREKALLILYLILTVMYSFLWIVPMPSFPSCNVWPFD